MRFFQPSSISYGHLQNKSRNLSTFGIKGQLEAENSATKLLSRFAVRQMPKPSQGITRNAEPFRCCRYFWWGGPSQSPGGRAPPPPKKKEQETEGDAANAPLTSGPGSNPHSQLPPPFSTSTFLVVAISALANRPTHPQLPADARVLRLFRLYVVVHTCARLQERKRPSDHV